MLIIFLFFARKYKNEGKSKQHFYTRTYTSHVYSEIHICIEKAIGSKHEPSLSLLAMRSSKRTKEIKNNNKKKKKKEIKKYTLKNKQKQQ